MDMKMVLGRKMSLLRTTSKVAFEDHALVHDFNSNIDCFYWAAKTNCSIS